MAAPGGPRARPAPSWTWRLRRALAWTVVAGAAALAALVALVPLPPTAAGTRGPTLVYGADGQLVAELGPGLRLPLAYAQIPYDVRAATLAAEDASFYRNFGIDPVAIARAALVDLRAHAIVEGGSTITQQLAKNLYLSQARTWGRKLLEVVYTLRLEATHSKDQILADYLNTIYYGEGAYGIGAAAHVYFDQPAQALDLAQAALLAAIPAAPARYDPFLHPQAARARRQWVLARMAALGFVPRAAAEAAAAEPLGLRRGPPVPLGPAAGYFVDLVLAEIGHHDPALEAAVRAGGYRVDTTLEPAVQAAADQAFAAYLPPGVPDARGILQPQGALVAIDPRTGAVRALVGGRNHRLDPFDRALYALRQPGSTFKPFVYATALGLGYPVTARQYDGPTAFPGPGGRPYVVHDYDGYTYRWITMREAMADSVNVVAVRWAEVVGVRRVIATARRMGLDTPLTPSLPLALGADATTPLALADAYVPLANGGWAIPAWAVVRVVDGAGHVAWAPRPPVPHRALDPGVAYLTTSLLESVMTDGTGARLAPIVGRPVAGKSGTTDGLRDAWFAGYTPDLVAVVWVGDDTPTPGVGYGSDVAGPIWAHFLAQALAGTPPRPFPRPSDVEVVTVSAVDGLLPNPTSPRVREVFLRGTAPTRRSPLVGYAGRIPGLIGIPPSTILPPPGPPPGFTGLLGPGPQPSASPGSLPGLQRPAGSRAAFSRRTSGRLGPRSSARRGRSFTPAPWMHSALPPRARAPRRSSPSRASMRSGQRPSGAQASGSTAPTSTRDRENTSGRHQIPASPARTQPPAAATRSRQNLRYSGTRLGGRARLR
jgi:1A family penicillin-binding protein